MPAKYAPPETTILIKADRLADELITIAVEDQGPGISAILRDRVFERFYRASSNGVGNGRAGGIGMGLAIAKGIVEAHGGRIWIENAKSSHGARIIFTVPVGNESSS